MEEAQPLIVTKEEDSLRLDLFLKQRFPHFSRTYFQTLISDHLVLVNDEVVKKRQLLQEGDEVEVEFALTKELSLEAENIPLDIIYEDPYLIIVNKPPNFVVHPAPGNWSSTFVNALLYHLKDIQSVGDPLRPGIVHRLDKDTSGLLIAAKTSVAHQKLVEAFAMRKIHKEYLAICLGRVKEERITTKIHRHPFKRKEMSVSQNEGKVAITDVFPLLSINHLTLTQFILHTGRTHQIRVHMQFKHSYILGDTLYGNEEMNKKYKTTRQLLHAHRLHFIHPITSEEMHFEAPLPQEFVALFSSKPINIPFRHETNHSKS